MAETLRDLVVNLSLDSSAFSTNIKHLNALMKETDSAFKLAAAGEKNFENTLQGMGAALQTQRKEYQLQGQLITQYAGQLDEARSRLEKVVAKHDALAAAYAASSAAVQAATVAHNELVAAMKEEESLNGKDSANMQSLTAQYEASKTALEGMIQQRNRDLSLLTANERSQNTYADAVTNATTRLQNAKAAYKETSAAIEELWNKMSPAQQALNAYGDAIKSANADVSFYTTSAGLWSAQFNKFAAETNLSKDSVGFLQEKLSSLQGVLAMQEQALNGYNAALSATRGQLNVLANESNTTVAQWMAAEEAVLKAETAYTNMATVVATTRNSIKEVENALSPATQAWNAYQTAIETANSNISLTQAGIGLWESELSRFAAETGSAKDSVEYLKEQLATLEGVLALQTNAMSQYEIVLESARGQLNMLASDSGTTNEQWFKAQEAVVNAETAYNNMAATVANTKSSIADIKGELRDEAQQHKSLEASIKKSESTYASLGSQITAIQAEYKALAADLQLSDSSYQGITAKLSALDREYQLQVQQILAYRDALEAARKELELANQSGDADRIRQASDAYYDMSAKLDNARASASSTRGEMETLSGTLGGMSESTYNFVSGLEAIGSTCASVGKSLYENVTKPVLEFAKSSEDLYMTFQSAEAKLRQVTSATDDQYATVTAAAKEMSEELGISAASIVSVMTEVGRLGIDITGNGESFISFARTVEDMSLTLGVSAESAGTSVARFFKVMGVGTEQITNYGSAVTYLANNNATTASEIIEMSQGLAGAAKTVGMSEQDVLGVATALSSVGITAGRGATAFSQALIKMETSVKTGDKYLDDFARVAGMTSEEFVTAWKDNPTKAFIAFITGLAGMDTATTSSIAALKECGINTMRLTDSLLRLKNAEGLVETTVEQANAAWQTNTELESASGKIKQTLRVKLNNLKQAFANLKTTIGNDLAPAFERLLNLGTGVLNWLNNLSPAMRSVIEWAAGIAAVAGGLTLVFGKIVPTVKGVITAISALSATAPAAAASTASVGTAATGAAAGVSMATAGIAALGVAAAATAAYLVYVATGEKAVDDAARAMNTTLSDLAENGIEGMFDRFKNGESALSLFGLTTSAFTDATNETSDWLNGLIDVWADGKSETNAIVGEWTDSFKESSDGVRDAIDAQRDKLDNAGLLTPETQAKMKADKEKLDAWDKEIANLLKKRQNGTLTDDDKARLSEVIKLRAELELEYSGAAGGYDDIIEKMKAEISRNLQDGVEIDPSLLSKGFTAMNEGYNSVVDSINAEYDAQYALIDAMEEGDAKDAALKALQEERIAKLNLAIAQYKAGLLEAAGIMSNNINFEDQDESLRSLLEQVQAYQAAMAAGDNEGMASALENINGWLNSDSLSGLETFMETYAMLLGSGASNSEIADAFGMTEDQLNSLLQTYKELQEISDGGIEGLENLGTLFSETLPSEVTEVLIGLNCTQAQTDWDTFVSDKKTFDTDISASARITTIDTEVIETLKTNGIDLGSICTVGVKLGTTWKTDLKTAYDNGNLEVFGSDGAKITVTPEVLGSINPSDLISAETDANGNIVMKVILTPEIGSTEAIDIIQASLSENPFAGSILSFSLKSIQDDIDGIVQYTNAINEMNVVKQALQNGESIDDLFGGKYASDDLVTITQKIAEAQAAVQGFFDLLAADPTAAGDISAQIANLIQALANPEGLTEEQIATYQSMLDVLTQFSTVAGSGEYGSVGTDVAAGVADGMQNYDFSESAASVASSIESSLRGAAQTHSPSEMTKPIGKDIAAGIGSGMGGYDFSTDSATLATSLMSSIASGLSTDDTASSAAAAAMQSVSDAITGSETDTSSIGSNLMAGIKYGIDTKRSSVVNAAVEAVKEAIAKAKAEAQIHSPSRVMRDEVGVMLMRGMGIGIDNEAKRTAKTMANATRYMTNTAAGVANGSTYNNQRTYNNQSSVTLNLDGLSVRDDNDIRTLAIELAQLTRRSHQSKGVLA